MLLNTLATVIIINNLGLDSRKEAGARTSKLKICGDWFGGGSCLQDVHMQDTVRNGNRDICQAW